MAMFIQKPWYRKSSGSKIYGAEWDGSSSPAWTRTDDAVGFVDPNPAVNGGTGSSPFDNIMPWAGMTLENTGKFGYIVKIPKFYYKWTRQGIKMKLQISESPFEGSFVSPAHMDRGDGVGERDYVYVGQYHCCKSNVSNYKSTNVKPINNVSRSTARNGIHNLDSTAWQCDFAMHWTIRMLYLVEFAHWDFTTKIGYGYYANSSSTTNQGNLYQMQYHTGTMAADRTEGGATQYRYIGNLGVQVSEWIDGIVIKSGSNQIYGTNNPLDFGNEVNAGTLVGYAPSKNTSSQIIKSWSRPLSSVPGFEYAIFPNSGVADSTYTTYVTDSYEGVSSPYGSGNKAIQFIKSVFPSRDLRYGLFYVDYGTYDDGTSNDINGCRLMVLP